jgi:hypothetical protein
MTDKRIMLTVSRKMNDFLDRVTRDSGIDRANYIRSLIWADMQRERDRASAERHIAQSKEH